MTTLSTASNEHRHYARYHTEAIAGSRVSDWTGPFTAFTNNHVNHPGDAHVWLIERKNDRYFLQAVFTIDNVGEAAPGGEMNLANQVQGHAGIRFIDLEIGTQPWWKEFFKSIGNGGLGICTIRAEYVKQLQKFTGIQLQQTGFIVA